MATMTTHQQQQQPAAVEAEAPPGPIYVDTQHEDLVHDTRMDYYGAKLATCSSGTLICLLLCFIRRLLLLLMLLEGHGNLLSHTCNQPLSLSIFIYRPHRQGVRRE